MDLKRIFYSVTRKWWLVLILAVLSGGIGYYLNIFSYQPMYKADTTLYVLNKDKVLAGEALDTYDLAISQKLIAQYSGIFYSRSVTSEAANDLENFKIPHTMLAKMVRISSEEESNLLIIEAVAPDPEFSAAAANVMANQFITKIRTLTNSNYIGILDRAEVPVSPIPNNALLKTILFIFGGLVIALGIIYVIEYFDTTVRSAENVEDHLKLRVIGIIPELDIS